jgi:cytoskeletal protein CcmA (bactofilin family)
MNALLRPGGTGGGDSWRDVSVSLGSDAEVSGRLSFTTATRIEGRLRGEVKSADLLVVGPQAEVRASVQADVLVVLGKIYGNVTRAERVEIRNGGLVFGDIHTHSLVVEEGGVFDGDCRMRDVPAVAESGRTAPPST